MWSVWATSLWCSLMLRAPRWATPRVVARLLPPPQRNAPLWASDQQLGSIEARRHGGRRRRLDLRTLRRGGVALGPADCAEDSTPHARASSVLVETTRSSPQTQRTRLPPRL